MVYSRLTNTGILLIFSRFLATTSMAKSKFEYVRNFESDDKCLPNSWIVVRLDGKCFHKFSDVHKFQKPNDKRALDLMTKAAASVFEELHDVCFGFGHSDEYSFVFRRNCVLYKRRHDKLLSLVTSQFSSAYVYHWFEYFKDVKLEYPPTFDGRIILYPTNCNIRDYLSWRQADVHVNNLHNTVFWALVQKKNMSTKEADERLKGTLSSEKNEILFSEFNINYNKEPEQFKKGTSLIRKLVKTPENGLSQVIVPLYSDIIKDNFWEKHSEILACKPAELFENGDNIPVLSLSLIVLKFTDTYLSSLNMTSASPPGAVIYPAADRNKPFILECLQHYVASDPGPRTLLEIGAGTGQHAAFFAPHFPHLTYQPTELDRRLLNSIEAFRASLNQPNLKEAAALDVTQHPTTWLNGSVDQQSVDYLLSVNMVHIAPWNCAQGLFKGAGYLLRPGGYLLMYGPFAVDGQITPESNVRFNQSLRAQNAEWGLRDVKRELEPLGAACGLTLAATHDLPANNKFLAWLKQSN